MTSLSLSPGVPDFDVDRPEGHGLAVADWAQPQEAYYYLVIDVDGNKRTEFHVCGAVGPQRVETCRPDGQPGAVWECRTVGDELVFYAPDDYKNGDPMGWVYDKRLQRGVRMSGEEMERRELRMRVSAVMGSG